MAQLSYIKNTEFKNLVRMIGTSIDGDRLVQNGLNQIKGVGARLAQAIIKIMKIDPKTRMGMLTDAQIEEIEKMIKSPAKYGIPNWMLNRQKDISTGENRHISGTDIDLVLKLDLDRMKRNKSWKGIRHQLGLKVRGQRTRCTGRRGLTIGYFRKKKKTTK